MVISPLQAEELSFGTTRHCKDTHRKTTSTQRVSRPALSLVAMLSKLNDQSFDILLSLPQYAKLLGLLIPRLVLASLSAISFQETQNILVVEIESVIHRSKVVRFVSNL